MSVLNAVLALQEHRSSNPNDTPRNAAALLSRGLASRASFDYDGALALIALVPQCSDHTGGSRSNRLRTLIEAIARADATASWLRILPLGRAHAATYLRDTNIFQCLESAGLYVEPIDAETLACWLRMQDLARATEAAVRTKRGMQGEELTLRNEREKLRAAGCTDLEPRWMSPEDNTLGYDVQSFEMKDGRFVVSLIEVKASDAKPLRFFVSRRQWEVAKRMAQQYRFHIWDLSSEALLTLTPQDMSNHMPVDQGSGIWHRVEVVLR